VSVEPGLEAPRPAEGDAFSDAVTFAFGDAGQRVCGLARLGIADGGVSGLAILFHGSEPVAVRADSGAPAGGEGWDALSVAGITTTIDEPLRRWGISFDGGAEGGFELRFEATGEPAEFDTGGMRSYEHLCRVSGEARVGGETIAIDALGQRGHAWGSPDWGEMTLARTVGAWLGDDLAVLMSAIRPDGAKEHGAEQLRAVVLEGAPAAPHVIEDPRLSTTYDAEGRQRRAGFELWADDESAPARRGSGEVLCGTTNDLGRLRLDCAFYVWRMEGRVGVGRYDVLRRSE